jgi:hypothetical protein
VSASLSSLIDLCPGGGPAGRVAADDDLLSAFRAVTDPRCRRGVRHQLVVVLGVAACAVLAGARWRAVSIITASSGVSRGLGYTDRRGSAPPIGKSQGPRFRASSRPTTVIRVNVLPNVLPNRAPESVICPAFTGLTEVSEGGLEPPRPVKGTSTSS